MQTPSMGIYSETTGPPWMRRCVPPTPPVASFALAPTDRLEPSPTFGRLPPFFTSPGCCSLRPLDAVLYPRRPGPGPGSARRRAREAACAGDWWSEK